MNILITATATAVLHLALSQAHAQTLPPKALSRGALLYETHCVACHDKQVHWRDNKTATDWTRLKAEVRRWQAQARLAWNDADIDEVARHLNDTIYRFARPTAARPVSRPPA